MRVQEFIPIHGVLLKQPNKENTIQTQRMWMITPIITTGITPDAKALPYCLPTVMTAPVQEQYPLPQRQKMQFRLVATSIAVKPLLTRLQTVHREAQQKTIESNQMCLLQEDLFVPASLKKQRIPQVDKPNQVDGISSTQVRQWRHRMLLVWPQ